jgi:NAD(P)-dependent dehydrogenase (short-subunit alcohol dehydrogenase family)
LYNAQSWPESIACEYVKSGKEYSVANASISGKTVLITGATAGIGRITARELAAAGARILLVARAREKAEATREWIRAQTGNALVEPIIADLSSLEGVRSVARTINSSAAGVDVLVNNVGAVFTRRVESVDGIEMTFALNHLAPFLLTNLLLDALKRRAPSRVVTVSSDAHRGATMDFDDLEGRRRYRGWTAYGRSKLANLLFTYELARRLDGSGITANALHPGFVASEFGKNNGGFMRAAMSIAQRLGGITVEEGARTSVYLAASGEVQGVTGKYFEKCRQQESSAASHDRDSMSRLWEISEKMTGLAGDGVLAGRARAH